MKNLSQNMVKNNSNLELNSHKLTLKRKLNHSGKENIDPLPISALNETKKDVTTTSNICKKAKLSSTFIAQQAPNAALNKLPETYFNALVDVCSNEYDFIKLADQNDSSFNKNVARELFSADPIFNKYVDDYQKMPEQIQLLISEFYEIDAEFIVRKNYLSILRKTLDCKISNNCDLSSFKYGAYTIETLLDRIWITLRQMENLNDRKVLKSTKINETLRKLLNETGVHVESNSIKAILDDRTIINKFENKIKNYKSPIKPALNIKSTKTISKQNLAKEQTKSIKKKFAPKNKPKKLKPKYKEERSDDSELTLSSSQSSNIYSDESNEIFCICKKESSGNMIKCDNDNCKIGWFHFKCVNLKFAPKGNWFCKRCSETKFKKK